MKIIWSFSLFLILVSCIEKTTELTARIKEDRSIEDLLINGQAPLNFESLQKYILRPKCMSCHSGEDAEPENDPIDFTSYESTMIDRFVPLLVKGIPEKSRLFQSVYEGEMPEEGTLSTAEIDFIKKWIQACAPKETLEFIPTDCGSNDDDDDGPGGDDDNEPFD